jgi:hypothetical protein
MNTYCIPHRKYIGVSTSGNRAVQNQKKPDDGSQPLERDKTGGLISAIERQVNAADNPDSCCPCQLRTEPVRKKRLNKQKRQSPFNQALPIHRSQLQINSLR